AAQDRVALDARHRHGGTRRADTSDDLLDAGREGRPARAAEAARQHDEAGVEDDVDRRHAVGDAAGQLVEEGAAAVLGGGGRAVGSAIPCSWARARTPSAPTRAP